MSTRSPHLDEDVRGYLKGFVASFSVMALLGVAAFAVGVSMGGGFHGTGGHQMALTAFDPMQQPAGMAQHYTFARSNLGLMGRIPLLLRMREVPCAQEPERLLREAERNVGVARGWMRHLHPGGGARRTAPAEGTSPTTIRSVVIEQFGGGALPA